MSKVVSEFRVKNYIVLKLDKQPLTSYYKYRIDGKEYDPVPIYDMPGCIAIESEKSFIDKQVEFI